MTETQRYNIYPVLRGERIYLRHPTLKDTHYVFNWERDNEVWRYDPHRPYSQSMSEFLPILNATMCKGMDGNSGLLSRMNNISQLEPLPILMLTTVRARLKSG